MSSTFPSAVGLATLLAVSLLTICATILVLYMVLVQIELQTTLSFGLDTVDDVELEESASHEEDSNGSASTTSGKQKKDNKKASTSTTNAIQKSNSHDNYTQEDDEEEPAGVARRYHLSKTRRAALIAIVAVITFMTYLLLVKSNANVFLSWIGMFTVLGLLLRQTIFEEIRRERLDRLAAIFTLVLVLAMSINLAVYANRQHAQGDIYEGKARIIGYDFSSYTQEKEDTVLRTDLEVAWGGWWGCPNVPDQSCEAFVSGALCETEEEDGEEVEEIDYDEASDDQFRSRKKTRALSFISRKHPTRRGRISNSNRLLNDGNADGAAQNAYQSAKEDNDNDNQDANSNGADEDAAGDENFEEQNQELEQENEDLEEENEELEEENEELQEELDEYEEYADEEAEEIEVMEGYSFDDDVYYDDYWGGTSWDNVWGEYACEDLFDYDVEGQSFDENDPPGSDEWPFVNIYGNCNTCEAYIVDYYSTEHFQSIVSYKRAGLWYGILAGIGVIATAYLMMKQKNAVSKSADKEIELLPTSEGALA